MPVQRTIIVPAGSSSHAGHRQELATRFLPSYREVKDKKIVLTVPVDILSTVATNDVPESQVA